MKKSQVNQIIICNVLKANGFNLRIIHDIHAVRAVFSRGEINKVGIFNDIDNEQFCITYECKNSKKIKEYRIGFTEHQSINKVLHRIELLLNKKLKRLIAI